MNTTHTSYAPFKKQIISYLDGSLSPQDRSEFEAFVATHPEFEADIRTKEDEVNLIKSLVPTALMGRETENSLENEIRTSVFNLMRKERTSIWEKLADAWEELLSR
jgi:anti-sigma factor RsiW